MDALSDGDPEGVATVLRLGLSHMAMTAKRLTDAMTLDRLDAEELLEKGESTALTFASNPACRGMQRQAGESVNPVSDQKTLAMTGLEDAFVKRGSPVQVRSSALLPHRPPRTTPFEESRLRRNRDRQGLRIPDQRSRSNLHPFPQPSSEQPLGEREAEPR